jgi:hypothetical protein
MVKPDQILGVTKPTIRGEDITQRNPDKKDKGFKVYQGNRNRTKGMFFKT